jgi:hypothetical protein
VATTQWQHKREVFDYALPSPKRQAELLEVVKRNVAAGKQPHEDMEVRTRGELIWTISQLPLDNAAPSPTRQDELHQASLTNVAKDRPPYDEVRVRTRGELEWVLRSRDWPNGKPDLRGIYLEDLALRDVNLAFANLDGAHLYRVDLSGADLNGARLFGTDLAKANLSRAILGYSWMNEATNLNSIVIDGQIRLIGARWNNVPLALVDWGQVPRLGDEVEIAEATTREERIQACRDVALAYRNLAITLRSQGLNREASVYRLHEQQLERYASRLSFHLGAWAFSWLLDVVAGYGEKPARALRTYLVVILAFAAAYLAVTHIPGAQTHVTCLTWDVALVLSITSFHGRGFFPGFLSLDDWVARVAALEAVIGLFIELIFIATFTRRFLGS